MLDSIIPCRLTFSEKLFFLITSDSINSCLTGKEVILHKRFVKYFYAVKEKLDNSERLVLIVKYGDDFLKINCTLCDFHGWYYNRGIFIKDRYEDTI